MSRSFSFPVYQIDFSAVAAGKRVAATKRRIRWYVVLLFCRAFPFDTNPSIRTGALAFPTNQRWPKEKQALTVAAKNMKS